VFFLTGLWNLAQEALQKVRTWQIKHNNLILLIICERSCISEENQGRNIRNILRIAYEGLWNFQERVIPNFLIRNRFSLEILHFRRG